MANSCDRGFNDHQNKTRKTAMQELDEYLQDPGNHLNQYISCIFKSVKAAREEFNEISVKFESRLQQLQTENKEIQKRLLNSEKDRERYRNERNTLRSDLFKLRKEEKHVCSEDAEQNKKKFEDLQNSHERLKKELDRKMKETEDSINEVNIVQQQKIEKLENIIKQKERKIQDLLEEIESSKFGFTEIGQLRKKLEERERDLNSTNDRLYRVASKLKETEKELDNTKTRLSKAMGDKLTYGNPQIADLSDTNRPTKLAERYAELYDNQWTEAFEELENDFNSDEEVIETLQQILLEIMEFCKQMARKQMVDLARALSCSNSQDEGSIPENVSKQLKECRRVMASVSKDQIYKVLLSNPQRGSVTYKYAFRVMTFVKECIEICWLMVIQDPPVVFDSIARRGIEFSTDVYKPYVRSGSTIEFVVWPALLLYKDGPVLAKGVAQGYGGKKRKEAWASSGGFSENASNVRDQVIVGSKDIRDTYVKESRSYETPPSETAFSSLSPHILKQRSQMTENNRYSQVDNPYRTRSTAVRKRIETKMPEENLTSTMRNASSIPYQRDPTSEEMNKFYIYYERRDFNKARNVLGVQVYERCWNYAQKHFLGKQ